MSEINNYINNESFDNESFDNELFNNDNSIVILKFDEEYSKYNDFFNKINESTGYKIVNMTDKVIINFYEIYRLPTIYVYKNRNLHGIIEGFHPKTTLIQKINSLLE